MLNVSVQFSCSVVSDSLRPHRLQPGPDGQASLPSPTPGACSNSCPWSWWCHPTISSSVIPFSRLQSLPASGSFPMSQFFTSGGQSIGVSAWTSVLPMNTQDWSPLGWTGWSPCSPRDSQQSPPQFKSINSSVLNFLYSSTLASIHDYWKTIVLTIWIFVGKVMSLLFNMPSGHSFSSKEQVSFNFKAAVTICSDFGAPKNKVSHCFHCFPIYLPWSDGTRCHDLSLLNVDF